MKHCLLLCIARVARVARVALALALAATLPGVATANTDAPTLDRAGASAEYARLSEALDNKNVGWENRVEILRRRGALLSEHFLLEQALVDFRSAVSLAPHYSMAHLDVATALTKLGRFPEAYRSYQDGFQANPANLVLFMTRGMTHYNDGKYKRAKRDFRRHLKFATNDMYRMLWLSLAVTRQGGDGVAELRKYTENLDLGVWPGPLVSLYLGGADEASVLRAVDADTGDGAMERHCEAYFFLGQWHRTRGDEAQARAYFQKTVDTNVRGFMEYASARLELERSQ